MVFRPATNVGQSWKQVLKLSSRAEKDKKATTAARNTQEGMGENRHWLAGTEKDTLAVLVLDWTMSLEEWQCTWHPFTASVLTPKCVEHLSSNVLL